MVCSYMRIPQVQTIQYQQPQIFTFEQPQWFTYQEPEIRITRYEPVQVKQVMTYNSYKVSSYVLPSRTSTVYF